VDFFFLSASVGSITYICDGSRGRIFCPFGHELNVVDAFFGSDANITGPWANLISVMLARYYIRNGLRHLLLNSLAVGKREGAPNLGKFWQISNYSGTLFDNFAGISGEDLVLETRSFRLEHLEFRQIWIKVTKFLKFFYIKFGNHICDIWASEIFEQIFVRPLPSPSKTVFVFDFSGYLKKIAQISHILQRFVEFLKILFYKNQ